MPYFSIIIPVYNVAPYLRECLDSVLAQSYHDWEAICVDDGSCDESCAILSEYARRDARVRVVSQANAGVVAARLNGFEHSYGDRILFLDGDDQMRPEALDALEKAHVETDSPLIVYGFRYVEQGVVNYVKTPKHRGVVSRERLLAETMGSPLHYLTMCIWNKCYAREVVAQAFADVQDLRIKHSEDGLFALAAFGHVKKVCFVPSALYDYRVREGSVSHSLNRDIVQEKKAFILRAESLMRELCRASDELVAGMNHEHAREAFRFVISMAMSRKVSFRDALCLIRDFTRSGILSFEDAGKSTRAHQLLKGMINYPVLFCALRPILRKKFPVL